MDDTGPQHPLSDAQLDRELESALGIEPSPEFLARVRTRIAAEPEQSLWRQAVWGRGVQPLVVAAIVGVVLAVVVPRFMRGGVVVAPGVHRTPVTQVAVEATPVSPPSSANDLRPIRRRLGVPDRVESPRTVPLQLSPVLFAEEDRVAFGMFVTAVANGRIPETVVQALGEADRAPLVIAPLEIDPLPLLTARARTEGETKW